MGDLLQEHGLANEFGERLLPEHRLGHSGEGRELVDHTPEVADLALDRPGQLDEGGVVLRQLGAIATVEPFGRQMDRGQRVLDLMRDPARDVRPGRTTLIRQSLRHVVEGQHPAVAVAHLVRGNGSTPGATRQLQNGGGGGV